MRNVSVDVMHICHHSYCHRHVHTVEGKEAVLTHRRQSYSQNHIRNISNMKRLVIIVTICAIITLTKIILQVLKVSQSEDNDPPLIVD